MRHADVRHPDVRLAELAAQQHGVVSRSQLAEIGLSDSAIRHRIEVKRLHRVYWSVYAVALPLHRYARYMGAVLVCGDGAALSHRSSASLAGIGPVSSGAIDVTMPCGGSRRRRGVAVHVTRSLPDEDVTSTEGIPCTTPMRTLVDLAGIVRHEHELYRALERSLELDLFDLTTLNAILERSHSRHGTRLLRRLLADLHDEPPPVWSEFERVFLELILTAGLPRPAVNASIGILQVDFQWPAFKLVVETDGRATHGHAIGFHRDRDRDLYLQERGWRVLRLSWRQVVHEPRRVVAALRKWLEPAE